jgi:hypothetical protein
MKKKIERHYADYLPRIINSGGYCQVLNDDSNRCRNKAKFEIYLFEDPETAHDSNWRMIVINVCGKHLHKDEKEQIEEAPHA